MKIREKESCHFHDLREEEEEGKMRSGDLLLKKRGEVGKKSGREKQN